MLLECASDLSRLSRNGRIFPHRAAILVTPRFEARLTVFSQVEIARDFVAVEPPVETVAGALGIVDQLASEPHAIAVDRAGKFTAAALAAMRPVELIALGFKVQSVPGRPRSKREFRVPASRDISRGRRFAFRLRLRCIAKDLGKAVGDDVDLILAAITDPNRERIPLSRGMGLDARLGRHEIGRAVRLPCSQCAQRPIRRRVRDEGSCRGAASVWS